MNESLLDFLKEQDVEYSKMLDMSRLSSMGVGGVAAVSVMPSSEEKLIRLLDFLIENKIEYKIAGGMSNILPPDGFYNIVLIKTNKMNSYFVAENTVHAVCGVSFSFLLKDLSKLDIGGAEPLFGIPGTIGGAICGNAGAHGKEISDFVMGASVYSPHEKRKLYLSASALEFSYRSSILKRFPFVLLSADLRFEYSDKESITEKMNAVISRRKLCQPYGEKSLGSIFKRNGEVPISRLIDELGLKGMSIGGAVVSEKHAGFIVNRGGASCSDVLALISIIKEKLYSSYGIVAEEEIEIWKNGV